MEKAVVLMKGKTHFPAPDEIQDQGYIDIWWIIHDGGLLLLIAHLLQKHRVWRSCKLRVHMVASEFDDAPQLAEHLKMWLEAIRMEADIDVIKCGVDVIEPYTANATLRLEEREKLMQDLKIRMGREIPNSDQVINELDELQPEMRMRKRSGSLAEEEEKRRRRSSSMSSAGVSVYNPKFFAASPVSGSGSTPPGAAPATTPAKRTALTGDSRKERRRRSDVPSPAGKEVQMTQLSQTGDESDGDDAPHSPLGALPKIDGGSGSGSGTGSGDGVEDDERHASMDNDGEDEGGYSAWQRGQELCEAINIGAVTVSPSGQIEATSRFTVTPVQQDGSESAEAASGEQEEGSDADAEAVDGDSAEESQGSPGFAPRPLGSVGRLYSGVGLGRNFTKEDRYQQFHALNQKIRSNMDSYMKAPRLVIVNLPDPLAEQDPVEYMQYVQILTEDVPTMLLVHGSGHEIISNFDTVVSEDYDDEVDADKEDGDEGDVR